MRPLVPRQDWKSKSQFLLCPSECGQVAQSSTELHPSPLVRLCLRVCSCNIRSMDIPDAFRCPRKSSFACPNSYETYLFQRALAALRAIAMRCFSDSLVARAFPPLRPPRRPRATAAGFLDASFAGFSDSPLICRTMEKALSLMSFLVPERSGMNQSRISFSKKRGFSFQNDTPPATRVSDFHYRPCASLFD